MKNLFVFLMMLMSFSLFATEQYHWGRKVSVGKGEARSYLRMEGKRPVSLGIALSPRALEDLPHEMMEFLIPLPKKGLHPYKHLTLDWNPHGHEPGGVYDRPHFDYHFYFISNNLRQSITCAGEDAAVCTQTPDEESMISNYAPTPGGEPRMGWHWVDLLAPEFNGGIFSRTFIYGYYDGNIIFVEPMVTLDFLSSKKTSVREVRRPERFPYQQGHYPSQYKVYFNKTFNLHMVELTRFKGQEF